MSTSLAAILSREAQMSFDTLDADADVSTYQTQDRSPKKGIMAAATTAKERALQGKPSAPLSAVEQVKLAITAAIAAAQPTKTEKA
jgi:hypothetical protein